MLSRGDSHHPAQRIARSIHHLYRVGSTGGGPVTKLTVIIRTHRQNRAVPLQIHRVRRSREDPHHPAQRIARSIHHLHRVGSLRWWSRHPVDRYNYNPPPKPCRPPSNTPYDHFQRRSPPPRSADCPIHPPPAQGWLRLVVVPSPSCPDSFGTRSPDRAVPLQIDRVIRSRGDPHHPAQRIARSIHHLHRVGAVGGGPVTQLAIRITPTAQTVPSPFK